MSAFPRVRDILRAPVFLNKLANEQGEDLFASSLTQEVIPVNSTNMCSTIEYFSIPNSLDQIATSVTQDVIPVNSTNMCSTIEYFTVPSS